MSKLKTFLTHFRNRLCGCSGEKIALRSKLCLLSKENKHLKENCASIEVLYQEHKEREAMLKRTIETLTKQVHEQKAIIDYTLLEKEKLEKRCNPEQAS